MYISQKIIGGRRGSVSRGRRIMCVNNIAAFFKSCLECVTICLSECRHFLQVFCINVVTMTQNDTRESNLFERPLPGTTIPVKGSGAPAIPVVGTPVMSTTGIKSRACAASGVWNSANIMTRETARIAAIFVTFVLLCLIFFNLLNRKCRILRRWQAD